MDFSTIAVDTDGARASITLDRPEKLNPLSTQTLRELARAARMLDEDEAVKVVVVSGRGRAFSAGADVAAFAPAGEPPSPLDVRAAADAGRLMAEAIEEMRALTIAAIHGHCVGGGVVLACACDLRVASEDTRFSIPEVDLGIPLAWGGIPRLVREIGPAMTKELVLTCRPFDAREAHALGLVNRVVADSELEREVEGLAQQLVAKSAFTLRATKQAALAATRELLLTDAAWSDADAFLTAMADPESRRAAEDYLSGLRRR